LTEDSGGFWRERKFRKEVLLGDFEQEKGRKIGFKFKEKGGKKY